MEKERVSLGQEQQLETCSHRTACVESTWLSTRDD